ncbi:MAG: SMC-Scp complex subunit ScpB [Verrucomicrobia bacterium]|nr:SMC-Scp complex subunit ScpB [Verrucomicrobiota bacterium]
MTEEPTTEIEGETAPPVPDTDTVPEPLFPLPRIIESILFASQKPVSAKELTAFLKGAAEAAKENPAIACFAKTNRAQLDDAIQQLEQEYAATGRSFEIRESAAGWQLVTKADFAPWLRQLFPENRQARLSAPAMETLAIIAYRQPITRADIEAVRGVAVDGVMQTLLDRNLVRIAGRAEIAGRPLLYETTQHFMEHFGLKNLDDLPNATELRRIPLPTATPPPAETPATTEPQTAPDPTPDAEAATPSTPEPPTTDPATPSTPEPPPAT